MLLHFDANNPLGTGEKHIDGSPVLVWKDLANRDNKLIRKGITIEHEELENVVVS